MTGQPSEARVLLMGMMAVGKSTVGGALAAATGWPYVDNDELVLRANGVTTRQVLDTGGRPAIRQAESRALRQALAEPAPLVAGVAAGVVEIEDDIATLRSADALVVWLHAPIEVLVQRVGTGEDRPWLSPDPEAALRRLAEGRDPIYSSLADLSLDTSATSTGECVQRILDALGPLAHPS
ncbi:shikimate kinase [Motilibacter rhizosphaerae]|uniref:Shikimate kinase n=1 Tax=Motilibacter rhizosphaerae TaxID=598652 RepID=A0A4Q7NRB6_9ACTN|nr:shikimate kinase [Motilibacter rhizosphaerae]RZS89581.1 shikimate kinase [Motilibacter rhizosphaerae]